MSVTVKEGGLYVTVPQFPGGDVDCLQGDLAVHHVELDHVATAPGHGQYPGVSHQWTASHWQLAEPRQHLRQLSQSVVRHVALAHVQGLEPGAVVGEGEDGGVSDGLAAPGVEVSELVAVTDEVTEAGVRDPGTLGDWEIPDRESIETEDRHQSPDWPEGRAQLGQLAQPVVGDVPTLRHRELPDLGTVEGDGLDPGVWNEKESQVKTNGNIVMVS